MGRTFIGQAGSAVVIVVLVGACTSGGEPGPRLEDCVGDDCSCEPNLSQCADETLRTCRADGSGTDVTPCAVVDGLQCVEDGGEAVCIDLCLQNRQQQSSLGCEFYPTVTVHRNLDSAFSFGVAISNPQDIDAYVTLTRNGESDEYTVPANAGRVLELSWASTLAVSAESVRDVTGSYRLESTVPVAVQQFSPMSATVGDEEARGVDATLLLPTHVWGNEHLVATRSSQQRDFLSTRGFLSIVGAEERDVDVRYGGDTSTWLASGETPAKAGETQMFSLSAGEVVQVLSANNTYEQLEDPISDLTGSLVKADGPVQVISGHDCAYVPINQSDCDHLEALEFPVAWWGRQMVVPAAVAPDGKTRRESFLRVVAAEDGTSVSFYPTSVHRGVDLRAGEYYEITASEDVWISADRPLSVTRFSSRSPSMWRVPSLDLFDTVAFFALPEGFDGQRATVVAPDDTEVTLDGEPISDWDTLDGPDELPMRIARIEVGPGTHQVLSSRPVGVFLSGWTESTRYSLTASMRRMVTP